ncbi:MAG: tetratricopeptide repeat protein [Terracidiphilus sp.]
MSTTLGLWPHWQVIVWAKQNRPTRKNPLNASTQPPAEGYVGAAACARCHADIYKSFTRTRMGRSLMPVTPASIKGLSIPATTYSANLDRHFDVLQKAGQLFQSEYQSGPNGKEIFRNQQQIEWIIGAGANGFGGLIRRGDFLFEAPVSFYSKAQHWELSPGYEFKDIAFNRPVTAGCISCHSGRPRPLDQATGKFAPEPFSQTSIGCENCHGPGAAHIRVMAAKNGESGGTRIVNPGRLNAELENDICMSCHEAGDSRVLKPGKTFQDFRPGTPLDDTFSILMVPRKRGDTADTDHVQHYYEMSMSKCFRSTAGQLRCATCHDPHVEPTAEEAPAYFNQKCMDCHASRTCTLAQKERQQTTPSDNCISCHMPRRSMPETAHTSLTNHRIAARPGEPWPDEAFAQTTAALPDLVHVNRVPGRAEEIPPVSLLEAYREISERKPEYLTSYRKLLDDLEQQNPNDDSVQLALGRRDLQSGDAQRAIEHFERSLQLSPQQAAAYGYLSQALEQQGRIADAIAASQKAISLDPYNPLLQKALVEQLIAGREYDKAIVAMDTYLKYFPEDAMVRQMLTIAKQ